MLLHVGYAFAYLAPFSQLLHTLTKKLVMMHIFALDLWFFKVREETASVKQHEIEGLLLSQIVSVIYRTG